MKKLTLAQVNCLAIAAHLGGLLFFYFLATRFLLVTYSTDTMVGTYAGLFGVLGLQNPYLFSIKPFLDQFNFPASFYTPRVDGSFEFHLNYPALSFLSLVPFYLAGAHDLRDGVLFFHIMTVLIAFGLAPSRLKAVGLIPFVAGFPFALVFSLTDSVWAFLLMVGAIAWYRDRKLGLVFVGLACATKQIALIVLPFLLIRLWFESSKSKRSVLEGIVSALAGFTVPNLPFIILSPSAWWAATVAPFLPGISPQVIGGVGLSELLINIGVTLPSSFFLGLMATAAAASLVFYYRRFPQHEHLCWLMPALILFFYYRSFPNYIAYWFIPLLAEILRRGYVGFRWNPLAALAQLRFWVSSTFSFRIVRLKLTSSLLVAIVVLTAFAGASGAYVSQVSGPKVEVQVNSWSDPDGIGATTVLETTLTNLSSEQFSLSFFVKWYPLPKLWLPDPQAGIGPNSVAHYTLTPTDALAAIPKGAFFKVLVFNSRGGELIGQSPSVQADLPAQHIANPHFKWWVLESETGWKSPFGWRSRLDGGLESSGIEDLSPQAGGLQLRLDHGSESNIVGRISVFQRVTADPSPLKLTVLQSPTLTQGRGAAFGVVFENGFQSLYFVFSDTASQRREISSPNNVTITVPVEFARWSVVFLDPRAEWDNLGWSQTGSWEFSIFLEASEDGVYYAYVMSVE